MINYDELDPGVRNLVRLLNENGFNTTDSGDGYSKDPAEFDMIMSTPHVHIVTSSDAMVAEARRLHKLLLDRISAEAINAMFIQASYSPADGVAVISLMGVLDKDLVV